MKRIITILLIILAIGLTKADYNTEQWVIDQINMIRETQWLSWLTETTILHTIATDQCNYMTSTKEYSHDRSTGLKFNKRFQSYLKGVNRASRYGETLGEFYYTPLSIVRAWWRSPTHKNVMINKIYTHIGVSQSGEVICAAYSN